MSSNERIHDRTYPEIILASQVDLGTSGNRRTLVGPGSSDGRRAVNSDLATGRETIVGAVGATDKGRIVSVVANTRAGHGISIAVDGGNSREQRSNNRVTHPGGWWRMEEGGRKR